MSAVNLKVVHYDDHVNQAIPESDPNGWELQQAFDDLIEPYLREELGRKPSTIGDYRTHLRKWEEYWHMRHRLDGMPYPVMSSVTVSDLRDFRKYLATGTEHGLNLSNRTVNKHVTSIQTILRIAFDEFEIDTNLPKLRPLPEVKAAQRVYLRFHLPDEVEALESCIRSDQPIAELQQCDELGRLYKAAACADWPRNVEAGPVWQWRTAIVIWLLYGLRTQEAVSYRADDVPPLTWRNIVLSKTPPDGGHARNDLGWLSYVPEKQKRLKPEPLNLPLNMAARAHLDLIRSTEAKPTDRVFPWPHDSNRFYDTWRRILSAAGLNPEYQIKNLRKTCSTWLNFHERGIGDIVTGHTSRSVGDAHYTNYENQLVQFFASDPPTPHAWLAVFDLQPTRQRRLF